jgi:hypothetical protein
VPGYGVPAGKNGGVSVMARTMLCATKRHDRCPGKVVNIKGWIVGDCQCECHKAKVEEVRE